MSARNGPGGMKTERRSPTMTSGVATPSVARNNITVVITTAATNPASNPAQMALFLVIAASMSYRKFLLCRREDFLCALHDHCRRDLLHAGVIKRALAQPTVIAGRTRQVHAHNGFGPLVRPDVNGICRTKHADHRFTERGGHVHRPRVVRNRHFGALDQARQICWSSFTAKINRSRRGGSDLPAARLIAFRARESNSKSFAKKLARDASKSFDSPVLCFPNRPGHKNNERFASGHTLFF